MSTEHIFVLVLAAVVLYMNFKATALVLRDGLCERSQRLFQLLLVWLLPVLGAILVFAVHRPAEKPSGTYREPPDLGEDLGFSHHGGRGRSHDGGSDD